jgi:cytochrome P450
MGGFVLALDGEAHDRERERISNVLKNAVAAHRDGLELVRTVSGESAGATAHTLDIASYASTMAVEWTCSFFGLPVDAKPILATAAAAIVTRTFENPTFPGCPFNPQLAAKSKQQVSVLTEILTRQQESDDLRNGTVFWELVHGPNANPDRAIADVIGLVGGPVELVSQSVKVVVDWALQSPQNWVLLQASANRSEQSLAQELEPVFSTCPITAMVPRLDERQRPVMVALWDSRRGKAPRTAPDLNPIFGIDDHACLGRDHALEAVAAITRPLFQRSGAAFVHKDSWEIRFRE